MRKHTTHFDDCGCRTGRFEKQIEALESRLCKGEECPHSARIEQMYKPTIKALEAKLVLKCENHVDYGSPVDKKIDALESLCRRMGDYLSHEDVCILTRQEAGEPTEDGGYRTKYAGKWYQSRPVDETPKCNCGLDELWKQWQEQQGSNDML